MYNNDIDSRINYVDNKEGVHANITINPNKQILPTVILSNTTGLVVQQDCIRPYITDGTYNLGTSGSFWNTVYCKKLYCTDTFKVLTYVTTITNGSFSVDISSWNLSSKPNALSIQSENSLDIYPMYDYDASSTSSLVIKCRYIRSDTAVSGGPYRFGILAII